MAETKDQPQEKEKGKRGGRRPPPEGKTKISFYIDNDNVPALQAMAKDDDRDTIDDMARLCVIKQVRAHQERTAGRSTSTAAPGR